MATIDKVRIVILGDSGVGKTSLVHLLAHNEPIKRPAWTVGCSVEVKLHEYKQSTHDQKTYFLEFWDVGGSRNHRISRSVFYSNTHGIILVHDLTNRKSENNLRQWLQEVLSKNNRECGANLSEFNRNPNDNFNLFSGKSELDPELLMGLTRIPIFIIGTKLDLLSDDKLRKRTRTLASQCNCDELLVNCQQIKSFSPGSTNAVQLSKFFDTIIERRFYTKNNMIFNEKRWPDDQNVFHID